MDCRSSEDEGGGMSFVPRLFIGIGLTNAYFTLRETYLHTSYVPGEGQWGNFVNGVYQGQVITEVRSHHHFNHRRVLVRHRVRPHLHRQDDRR
jgi:hypothetical protein